MWYRMGREPLGIHCTTSITRIQVGIGENDVTCQPSLAFNTSVTAAGFACPRDAFITWPTR